MFKNYQSLELAWDNNELRELCEDEDVAKTKLGGSISETLKKRLADLAAGSFSDIRETMELEVIKGVKYSDYRVNLGDDFGLVFCSNHVINPPIKNGDIDWDKVFRIRIIKIGKNDD